MAGYCIECGDVAIALGLCSKHYMRQRRAGQGRTPEERKRMRMNVVRKPPKQLSIEQRGATAVALQRREPPPIKLPYLRFMDPEQQRIKNP